MWVNLWQNVTDDSPCLIFTFSLVDFAKATQGCGEGAQSMAIAEQSLRASNSHTFHLVLHEGEFVKITEAG